MTTAPPPPDDLLTREIDRIRERAVLLGRRWEVDARQRQRELVAYRRNGVMLVALLGEVWAIGGVMRWW